MYQLYLLSFKQCKLIEMIQYLFLLNKILSLNLINKNNLCYKNFIQNKIL